MSDVIFGAMSTAQKAEFLSAGTASGLAASATVAALGTKLDGATSTLATNSGIPRAVVNLYNFATRVVDREFVGVTSATQASTTSFLSGLIPVKPSTQYATARYAALTQNGQTAGYQRSEANFTRWEYDANQQPLARVAGSSPFTTRADAAFIQFQSLNNAAPEIMLVEGATGPGTFQPYNAYRLDPSIYSRKFEGKTLAVLGDSLSVNSWSWWNYLLVPLGFKNNPNDDMLTNPGYAVAGSAIADRPNFPGNDAKGNPWSGNSFYQRRTAIDTTRDVLIIGPGGTNDWSSPDPTVAEFGTMASRNSTSFYGALHLLFQWALDAFAEKPIYIVTPPPRQDAYTKSGSTITGYSVGPLGKTLEEYVNAIIQVAAFYGIPCIDIFHASELRPTSATSVAANYADLVHPTPVGQGKVGRQIRKGVEGFYL